MEIDHLKDIIVVAKYGSFTRAAQELYTSQSTLSKRVASMERELGIKLFERNGGSLILTEQGALFVRGAQDIVQRSESYLERIRRIDEHPSRTLVIVGNLRRPYPLELVTKALTRLGDKAPFERASLHDVGLQDCAQQVLHNNADLAICYSPSCESYGELHFQTLYKTPYGITVHRDHPLAKKDAVSFSDLAEYSLYTYLRKDRNEFVNLINSVLEQHGLLRAMPYEPSLFCGLPDRNTDVLVGPYFSSYNEYYPEYCSIPLDWPSSYLEVVAIVHKHNLQDPIVESLLFHIVEEAQRAQREGYLAPS